MQRNALGVAVLAALVASSPACQSTASTPIAPSISSTNTNDAAGGGGGSSLKGSAPVPQAPVNNVTTSTLTPALVVSGGGLTYVPGVVQYRFRVMDALGNVAAD